MNKTAISILIAAVFVSSAIFLFSKGKGVESGPALTLPPNNVVSTEGKQVIEIDAKGGYSPRLITAKANTPTVFKVKTNGTFDCSSSLTIPSLGYRANLPPSGETLIEVPPQKLGSTLRGICSMGMYSFAVNFN